MNFKFIVSLIAHSESFSILTNKDLKNDAMKFSFKLIIVFFLIGILSACSDARKTKVKLAINPWPGYQFLYLAKEKSFFEQAGLNVELVEAPSLAEVKRYFKQGKANAMTSSMIEAVSLATMHQKNISIVLVTDYSNGGDMILAKPNITHISQLKNKRVGVELNALGTFVLHQALATEQLTLSDVELLNTEQLGALESFNNNEIDAFVTYSPYSNNLLKELDLNMVFNSKQIPQQILDIVVIADHIIEQDPTWITRFHQAWQLAINYSKKHPIESHNIMAKREGISAREFTTAMSQLQLIDAYEQKAVLQSANIQTNMQQVCNVLNIAKAIEFDCRQLNQYLSVGQISD